MPNEILESYLKRCRRKRITPRTVEQYRSVLERFLGVVTFPAAGINAIEDYIGKIGEKYSTSTVRLHAAILSGFFGWCVRHGYLERNFIKDDVAVPRQSVVHPHVADVASVKAVINNPEVPLHVRVAVAFGYFCGLRRAEIARLKVKDINLDTRLVCVRGKGGKERTIPIGDEPFPVIKEYLDFRKGAYVFGAPGTKGVHEATIWRWIRKHAGTNPHSLRHAMGVEATRKGIPLPTLSRYMGHENPATTYKYTQMAATDIEKVAEVL